MGRRRDIGTGSARKVSLAAAQEKAGIVRSQVEAGLDPVAERRKSEGIPTFREAAAMRATSSKYVVQGARHDKPMSDMTLMKVLRDLKAGCTAQGFRSSFRDWVSESTSFAGDLAEAALAHAIGNKTKAAYRRGNLLDKRRRLMDAWGTYCEGATDSVVQLAVAS